MAFTFKLPDPWTEAELQAYAKHAIEAGLAERSRREILLMHVPVGVRDRFPICKKAHDQMVSDLRQLAALPYGYFERWAANASELVHPRFRPGLLTALDPTRGRPNPIPPPPRKPSPKKRKTSPLLIVVMLVFVGVAAWAVWQRLAADAGAPPPPSRAPASE